MIHVVVIEDTQTDSDRLVKYIQQFSEENDVRIGTRVYTNGLAFFEDHNEPVDVVFVDIHMPHMSGMEVATRIRERNKDVLICFVTNLAQYAIEGYSVNAFDFVLKPVSYYAFVSKLRRICNEVISKKKRHAIAIFDRRA